VAQWLGQFSGNTHATRVADLEAALRHAATALRDAEGTDAVGAKAKAVRRLAKRLLSARLRAARAKLGAVAPVVSEKRDGRRDLDALRSRESIMQAEGVAGILTEFGVSSGPAAG
jgi:hypothetical protein